MEELVEKAKSNDEKAFDEIITLTKKEMYLIAKARLKNDEDIADVIQETILSCYKNIKKLKNNSYFKTWIIKILINECNKIYRKKGKNDISFEDKEMENYIKSNEEEIPEFDILINKLNDDEKLILTLYYYSGYTTKEISKIIKKNEGTIRSKISRAKDKLRNQYMKGERYEKY